MKRWIFAVLGLCAACASPAPRFVPPSAATEVRLSSQQDDVTGVASLAYGPYRVTTASGRDHQRDVRLSVGAIYASHEGGGSEALALVFVGRNPGGERVFTDDRRVLLEADGALLTHAPTKPLAAPRRGAPPGQETLVVPVSRAVLEQLASAEEVGGRIGLWLTFDLTDRMRGGFQALLDAIPADALRTEDVPTIIGPFQPVGG